MSRPLVAMFLMIALSSIVGCAENHETASEPPIKTIEVNDWQTIRYRYSEYTLRMRLSDISVTRDGAVRFELRENATEQKGESRLDAQQIKALSDLLQNGTTLRSDRHFVVDAPNHRVEIGGKQIMTDAAIEDANTASLMGWFMALDEHLRKFPPATQAAH